MAVDSNNRMLVAILLILWVSAVVSSFIDNIPFTTAMVGHFDLKFRFRIKVKNKNPFSLRPSKLNTNYLLL